MHTDTTPGHLHELFGRVAGGLLWVQADGEVRHASEQARRRTALRSGDVLDDPALLRAVQFAARGGQSRSTLYTDGERLLSCRVVPGLGQDDALVMLAEATHGDSAAEGGEVLMRSVDQHLRAPLQRAQEALSLWHDEADAHALQSLVAEVDGLLRQLDRLCELSRLWSGSERWQEERVELWALLQQAWTVVEPQALDRGVGLRFRCEGERTAQVAVYGHRGWLLRVLVECLGAAVAACPAGGQLSVEQRQLGTRTLLRFGAGGMFLDADAGGRDTVALALCRQVLALHGGTLKAEPGEACWQLELPAGAPAGSVAPALGMAQAQVYARDLAALMHRTRRRAIAAP
jgi:signal transduction histidine kinase